MASRPSPSSSPSSAEQSDSDFLAELGYEQELHRGMSGFSSFAVSFSIISILAGCITTYYLAMDAGGPVAINIGWPVVGVFVLCVGMAMAEICSCFPTAGGLYWWASKLATIHCRRRCGRNPQRAEPQPANPKPAQRPQADMPDCLPSPA